MKRYAWCDMGFRVLRGWDFTSRFVGGRLAAPSYLGPHMTRPWGFKSGCCMDGNYESVCGERLQHVLSCHGPHISKLDNSRNRPKSCTSTWQTSGSSPPSRQGAPSGNKITKHIRCPTTRNPLCNNAFATPSVLIWMDTLIVHIPSPPGVFIGIPMVAPLIRFPILTSMNAFGCLSVYKQSTLSDCWVDVIWARVDKLYGSTIPQTSFPLRV